MNNQELKERKIITSLYEHFKDTPKKLKIVFAWDEVIQACEPYALWLAKREVRTEPGSVRPSPLKTFSEAFDSFWGKNTNVNNPSRVKYSPCGSNLSEWCISISKSDYGEQVIEKQQTIKNSPNFYQQAPFLTIADDLLKLIKEDKVEKLIFLSAYDKRVFPNGDPRKKQIFSETFGKIKKQVATSEFEEPLCSLKLLGFNSEKSLEQNIEEGNKTKPMWIGENILDLDILIDDNPNICGNMAYSLDEFENKIFICSPYYPSVEKEHVEDVLLLKTSVSDLTKEDFK